MNHIYIDSLFSLVEKSATDEDAPLKIAGYANTTKKDRMGDVIPSEAWTKGGLDNFKNNPILLAYHDHTRPVGRVTELSVDEKGLRVVAEISKAASDIYQFVKDGILRAFSIGAIVKDADYDSKTDIFVIKDLELLELSIVSVPANQDSLFSVSKDLSFDEFKKQFMSKDAEPKEVSNTENKEEIMTKEELELLIKGITEAVKPAAPAVQVVDNSEKLVKDLETRFEKALADERATFADTIKGLESAIKEKSAELEAALKTKMVFQDKPGNPVSMDEMTKAVLVAKGLGKAVDQTNFGRKLLQKAGGTPHTDNMTNGEYWETQVSNNMLAEIRRALVVTPLFRTLPMSNPLMRFPVNPEAGFAEWIDAADYGTDASTGTAQLHRLKDIDLASYKLATKEFLNNEEEEDTVIALTPIIRDAIIRRMAKAVDKAVLRGTAAGAADPLKGIVRTGAGIVNSTAISKTAAVAAADLIQLRRNLGYIGLNPSDVLFIVSTDVYYDLLEDTDFQTVDKIGADRATLRTGQIGVVAGVPVLVSGEFAARDTGTAGAVAVYTPNFVVGEHVGFKMESEYSVEKQRRVIVATRRMAFTQISTTLGDGAAYSNCGTSSLIFAA